MLIRHAESNVIVKRIIGGYRSCDGLSELGRQQAHRLRDRLAAAGELAPDVLISSNFLDPKTLTHIGGSRHHHLASGPVPTAGLARYANVGTGPETSRYSPGSRHRYARCADNPTFRRRVTDEPTSDWPIS